MVTHGLKMRQGGKHGKGDERTMRDYAVGTLQRHQEAGAQGLSTENKPVCSNHQYAMWDSG